MYDVESKQDEIGFLQAITFYQRNVIIGNFHKNNVHGILHLLRDNKYITSSQNIQVSLTEAGLKAKELGGHLQYLKYIKEREELDFSIKKLTLRSNVLTPFFLQD